MSVIECLEERIEWRLGRMFYKKKHFSRGPFTVETDFGGNPGLEN